MGLALLYGLAALSVLAGAFVLVLHLTTDPLVDVHAYYDAGQRLNAGQPLYLASADTRAAEFYRYPPLLAIAFRPLALLPFEVAALIWEGMLLAVTVLVAARLRRSRWAVLAACFLAIPIAWTLAIGQAQALVTFLLLIGSPWSVALAGSLKVLPALAAVYWVGRREWRQLGWFVGAAGVLVVVQLALEPTGTLAYLGFLSLDQVGEVNNFSPYAVSPLLWAAAVVVLTVVALRLAPTRWGWAAGVVLSVFATPRLLTYQLSSLLGGFLRPESRRRRDRD